MQKYLPVWNDWATDHGLHGESLRSIQYKQYREQYGEDDDRVLTCISASMSFVVALLAKWTWLHKNAGGFGNAEDKRRTLDLLQRLIRYAAAAGPFGLQLWTNGEVTRKHHVYTGERPVVLQVDADGVVDMSPLVDEA